MAQVVRSGVVESVHHGHVVGLAADGAPAVVAGDPDVTFFPRSSLKPVQAVAMLRAGLDLSGELLALAAASHSGEPAHLDGVHRILAGAASARRTCRTPPDRPLDPDQAARWSVDGPGTEPLAQNCSGKHAGHARHLPRSRLGHRDLSRSRPSAAAGDPGRPWRS